MTTTEVNILIDDKHTATLYRQLEGLVNGNKVTTTTLLSTTVHLMKCIEKYDDITGEERKKIVIQVITQFISDTMEDSKDKEEILLIVRLALPSFIDNIISVDKGQIIIKTKKYLESVFSCCK